MNAQQKAIAQQIEANFPNTECYAVDERLYIESYKEIGYVENGVFVATTKLNEKLVAEFQESINEVLTEIETTLNVSLEEAMEEIDQYFETQETVTFEVGKTYASVYNSGIITVTARTAKFIKFTEEINGKERNHTIITTQGIIETDDKIVERKKVKELNGTEYITNGIYTYYAKNKGIETQEDEKEPEASQEAIDLGVTQVYLNEVKKIVEDFYKAEGINQCDGIWYHYHLIDGTCKCDIELPKPTTEKIIAMCDDVKVIETTSQNAYQGKVWEYKSNRVEVGEKVFF
jgi:hypothetical protein